MQLTHLTTLSLSLLSTFALATPFPVDADAASKSVCMKSLTPQCCNIRKTSMDLFECQGLPPSPNLNSKGHWVRHCRKRNMEATCCQNFLGTTICTKEFLRKHGQKPWTQDEPEVGHGNVTEMLGQENKTSVAEGEATEKQGCLGSWTRYFPTALVDLLCPSPEKNEES